MKIIGVILVCSSVLSCVNHTEQGAGSMPELPNELTPIDEGQDGIEEIIKEHSLDPHIESKRSTCATYTLINPYDSTLNELYTIKENEVTFFIPMKETMATEELQKNGFPIGIREGEGVQLLLFEA